MNKDYSILLENLLERRYDETLRMPIVSDAFEDHDYPKSVRYALESMEEINPSYTYKTFHLAKRIQEKIGLAFYKRNIPVEFRYQGSIQTETHILLYSGVELIVLPSVASNTSPSRVIEQTFNELFEILSGDEIQEVNYNSKHKIKLTTEKPSCELTVIPAVWINNPKFMETKREIDRGICEYNLEKKTRRRYLPFLNIARINGKDDAMQGGLKRTARLLRSLQRDAKDPIELNNYEICSMLYAIPDLSYDPKSGLGLLPKVARQLHQITTNKEYRQNLVSPSEKELVFGKNKSKTKEVQKLKKELDELISDLKTEMPEIGNNLAGEIPYH